MGRSILGTALVFGVVIGGLTLLFGTKTGERIREQVAETAANVPNAVQELASQVDMDEVAGVLAERAIAELRPSLGGLFKIGR